MDKRFRTTVLIMGVLLVAGGVWFLLSFSVSTPSESPFTSSFSYNVILISIDTLRADHLGMYGYSRDTSPNLDRFAEESILFEQAIAQAPYSLASHASLFLSQYSSVHGLISTLDTLDVSKYTLAEVLQQSGYKTAAFVAGNHLGESYGFAQGFGTHQIDESNKYGSFQNTIPSATEWLKRNKGENFFLFVHGYDVHPPLHKPEPFDHIFDPNYDGILRDHEQYYLDYDVAPHDTLQRIKNVEGRPTLVSEDQTTVLDQRDIDHIVAHYDGGILYTDSLLKQFFETLKEMGLYDTSIIILFSDHGESLGDSLARDMGNERLFGHGRLYEEDVHVPLLIRHPDFRPQSISTQVQLIDIFPTIFDFIRILLPKEVEEQIQGKSLVPLIEGNADENFNEYVFGRADGHQPVFIRTNQWKLVSSSGDFVLYNLHDDPKETQDVINQYSDVAEKLKQKLEEWMLVNIQKRTQ
ncbi:sulfatase [Patescibacteria group bacterium]|nr:sulfatase [Patescibacteria group bacterium]